VPHMKRACKAEPGPEPPSSTVLDTPVCTVVFEGMPPAPVAATMSRVNSP
jgi:hypothetical protein